MEHNALIPVQRTTIGPACASLPAEQVARLPEREGTFPVHVVEYWRILQKRRWSVLSTFFLVLLVAAVGTWNQIPVYRASLKVQIDPEQPDFVVVSNNQPVFSGYVPPEVVFQTQLEALTSNTLATRVIRALKLDKDPRFIRNDAPSLVDAARSRLLQLFPGAAAREPKPAPQFRRAGKNRPISPYAGAFVAGITVAPMKDSRVIQLSYDATDPLLAAEIVNTLAAEYVQMTLETRYNAATVASDFLAQQLAELKAHVETSEGELVRFAREHNISSLGGSETVQTQKLAELNTALTAAQAERIQKESVWKSVRQSGEGGFPDVLRTEEIRALESSIAQLKQQKARLLAQFKPGWPEVKQITGQLNEAETQLAAEREAALKRAEAEYHTFRERERLLAAAVEAQKAEVNSVNRDSIQYNILKREVDSNKQLYDGLLLRTKEAGVSAGLKSNNIHVVDPAEVPAAPFKPDKAANMGKALALGLLLGIALAFFSEYVNSYFDRSIKTPDDIDSYLRLPFLGLIPLLPDSAGSKTRRSLSALLLHARRPETHPGGAQPVELITLQDSRSLLSEAYRNLRTSVLLSSSAERAPKSLLVTSSHKGEGKTTTAINLAVTLAQAGEKVLVLDCDMRNPSVAQALGLDNAVGLSTMLSGNAEASAPLIRRSVVPDLFVCPAGQIPPNPAELIGSARFRKFIAALGNAFDHIIIDSPPLLSVTDARILASMVDGVILVIKGGETTREAAERSRRLLLDVHARILGTMLNKVDMESGDPYYSKYQYDRYGYGYGS